MFYINGLQIKITLSIWKELFFEFFGRVKNKIIDIFDRYYYNIRIF